MRLLGRRRRRSRGWWGVVVFALLATGAYLAFDVLDLDGSDLRARPAPAAATAEPARAEPEDGHHPGPAPDAPRLRALLPGRALAALSPAPSPGARAIVVARRSRALPRGHVGRAAGSANSTPSDPA